LVTSLSPTCARDVLDAVRIIEQHGAIDSAKRVLGY
jgi:hypothetical protein